MSKRTSFAIKWALVMGFIWLVLHVVSGVRNLVGLMFEAYDDRTLGYAAAYLVCLLHWGYCRLALYRAGNSSATAF